MARGCQKVSKMGSRHRKSSLHHCLPRAPNFFAAPLPLCLGYDVISSVYCCVPCKTLKLNVLITITSSISYIYILRLYTLYKFYEPYIRWLITASDIINISDGCIESEITLQNAKLRFQMRNYASECEITLSNAKLRFRMQNYALECEITLSNAKLHFRMRNYASECEITLPNAKLHSRMQNYALECKITLLNAKLRFRMRNYAFECEITHSTC